MLSRQKCFSYDLDFWAHLFTCTVGSYASLSICPCVRKKSLIRFCSVLFNVKLLNLSLCITLKKTYFAPIVRQPSIIQDLGIWDNFGIFGIFGIFGNFGIFGIFGIFSIFEDTEDIKNAEIAVNAEDIEDAEIISISQILDMYEAAGVSNIANPSEVFFFSVDCTISECTF